MKPISNEISHQIQDLLHNPTIIIQLDHSNITLLQNFSPTSHNYLMVGGNSVVLVVLFQCNLLLLSGVLDVSSCSGIRSRIKTFRNNDKYIYESGP